jgi:predicted TIM-barrel fold metal-dependent hydrolase
MIDRGTTPLFDANAHPSLSGAILKRPASFPLLLQQLLDAGFIGACAVGLPARGNYDHRDFLSACREYQNLVPVAGWSDVSAPKIEREIFALQALGYRAIKVHPRLSGLSVRDARFAEVLQACASAQLVVFHCTYQFGTDGSLHPIDPLPPLMDAVARAPNVKMVLLHGGGVEVLRYSEAIRTNPNLLLDLSLTLTRYKGSSVDFDIAHLFNTFDRRMCLGSDFPEYTPSEVRDRFEALASGLSQAKRDNIGWRNIMRMVGAEKREV